MVVDYSPNIIAKLQEKGIDHYYGDVNDAELFNEIDLSRVKLTVSTVPKLAANMLLIRKIIEMKKDAIIVVTAHSINDALQLYDAGATYVLLPHILGGAHTSYLIKKHKFNISEFRKIRDMHIKQLNLRKERGHESVTK